jgi:hypothetical protein
MIRKIKFNNFYSFDRAQEINFLAKKKKSYSYFSSKSGDQITKIAAFIGGNASGKTNIMRLFSFISYFICISVREDSKRIALKNFFNNKKVTNFYIEFEKDDSIFFYQLSVRDNMVISEKLDVKAIIKNAQKKNIFLRNSKITLNDKYFSDLPKKELKNMRDDVSLVAFLHSNFKIDIINSIFDYFNKFQSNINERGIINHHNYQTHIAKLYLKDEKLKKTMEEFVSSFDVGLTGFKIVPYKKEDEEKTEIIIHGIHSTNKINKELEFIYESRGTRSLFFVLAEVLTALKNNSIAIIDELESGFHPEAMNKIISYFIDKNKSGKAQMIFASHSFGFMNQLDMHQIYLVQKDSKSVSDVYRLNQVEGVRPDENFQSKYMSGAYGAFPKIRV